MSGHEIVATISWPKNTSPDELHSMKVNIPDARYDDVVAALQSLKEQIDKEIKRRI